MPSLSASRVSAARCASALVGVVRAGGGDGDQFYGRFGPPGGARTYATYNAKAPYGDARYLLINTTGVSGGGIVRAVVRLGDLVNLDDRFDYCDPNFASTRSTPAASWVHGTVTGTRIAGWLPRRC